MRQSIRSSKTAIGRRADASPYTAGAALEKRFRQGEADAVAEVWQRFYAVVCRRIQQKYKRLLPPDMVQQVVLEAFSDACRNCAGYDPRQSPLDVWLRSIAEHKAADCCKRPYMRARRLELPLAPEVLEDVQPRRELLFGEEDDEESAKRRIELLKKVHAALAALPDGEREVLWADACSPQGQVSSTVLAAEMGVTPEAIRQRRRRGKARIDKQLRCVVIGTVDSR